VPLTRVQEHSEAAAVPSRADDVTSIFQAYPLFDNPPRPQGQEKVRDGGIFTTQCRDDVHEQNLMQNPLLCEMAAICPPIAITARSGTAHDTAFEALKKPLMRSRTARKPLLNSSVLMAFHQHDRTRLKLFPAEAVYSAVQYAS
jgi:hypothetical protein